MSTVLLNAAPHVYTFTMHQLQTMILSICGGITAISASIAVIIKFVSKVKEPDNKQNQHLEEHDKKLTMKALLALLSHGIDGNAIEPMKEAKAALENYLIDGQNNTKNG